MRPRLYTLADLPDSGAIGFDLIDAGRTLPVLVCRDASGPVRGSLNGCPHTGIRLEWGANDFFESDGWFR